MWEQRYKASKVVCVKNNREKVRSTENLEIETGSLNSYVELPEVSASEINIFFLVITSVYFETNFSELLRGSF